MKPEKVRELSEDDLKAKEKELCEQLFRLRFQKAIGQLDNALKVRETRRDIARVKTILKEKQGRARRGPEVNGNGRHERSTAKKAAPPQRAGGRLVVSAKMQKTVVVAVERLVRHDRLPQDHQAHLHLHGPRREGGEARRHACASWRPGPSRRASAGGWKRSWSKAAVTARRRPRPGPRRGEAP